VRPHYSPTWLAMRVPAKNVSTPEITDRVPPEVCTPNCDARARRSAPSLPPGVVKRPTDDRLLGSVSV